MDPARRALAPLVDELRARTTLRVAVTGRDKDADLAKRRAEAVKWYLVDQGVAADRIETGIADGTGPPLEMALVVTLPPK
jgi:hypothetical protein